MFCRNCGARLTDQDRFCNGCGTPAISLSAVSLAHPPQAQRRRSKEKLIIGLLLFFCLFMAIGIFGPYAKTTGISTSSVSHKIGDNIIVGHWAYRCDGASWQRSIGSEYSKQYADAEFLVVDLNVRNNDRTASILPPLKLIDGEGREYEESSKGIFIDHSFGLLKSINPTVSSSGYAVFDVPRGKYQLKVSGGFTSDEWQLIDLP
jgi:hypothetical protein